MKKNLDSYSETLFHLINFRNKQFRDSRSMIGIDYESFIIISTNNLSSIPSTIKRRYHISRIPKPSIEEVKDFLFSSNQKFSASAVGFLSEKIVCKSNSTMLFFSMVKLYAVW